MTAHLSPEDRDGCCSSCGGGVMVRLALWFVGLALTPAALTLVWVGGAWVAERRRSWRVAR